MDYSCGSLLLPKEHGLAGVVFVRLSLRCNDPVDLLYYSSKLKLHGVCCYCASKEATKPQAYTGKFFTVLPIRSDCIVVKPVITKIPKASSKRKHVD